MHFDALIHNVVRQTTLLIAHLATASGQRATLSRIADDVFLSLVNELRDQGLGNRVIADMFGLALRTYHNRVRRSSESRTERGVPLGEAILSFIGERGVAERFEVLKRFNADDEETVLAVVRDFVETGVLERAERSRRDAYKLAGLPDGERTLPNRVMVASNLVLVALHNGGPMTKDQIASQVGLQADLVEQALDELDARSQIRTEAIQRRGASVDDDALTYVAARCVIPYGDEHGWEAAVFDHFQSIVTAIVSKLRLGATRSRRDETIGGSTYHFEIYPGHPKEAAVSGVSFGGPRSSLALAQRGVREDDITTTGSGGQMGSGGNAGSGGSSGGGGSAPSCEDPAPSCFEGATCCPPGEWRCNSGSFQSKYWSPKNIPVLSASGEVVYILHRVEDVTDLVQASELGQEPRDRTHQMEREVIARSRELAQANANLRAANEKLGELDKSKTAFFSNVSHEFRTPLTLILSPVERAVSTSDGSLSGEDLKAVHGNALRLLRLVNSLLDFSRLESGRMELSFAPVDLALLTRGITGAFQSLFDDAGLRLSIDCPALPEPVYVDVAQWEKVVMNLISNAFKFTFEGEVRVTLRLREDRVEFSVSDTGSGIPEHQLPRIFERFQRIEGARGRSFEGSGIGLSLVSELVSQHGGEVHVKSELGRGATFVVSLRRGSSHLPPERIVSESSALRDNTQRTAAVLEAKQWMRSGADGTVPPGGGSGPTTGAPGSPRGRVLVADDNADMRSYLGRLLSPHWETQLVSNGKAALAAALATPPWPYSERRDDARGGWRSAT